MKIVPTVERWHLSEAYDTTPQQGVAAEVALYDCPREQMHAILTVLRGTGFTSSTALNRAMDGDQPSMTIRRRYFADHFSSDDSFFARLSVLGAVGLFWNGAEYPWSPSLVYIARGEWRKLPSHASRPIPLISVATVQSAMEDGSFEAISKLDDQMGGDIRRIVEMAAATCGDDEQNKLTNPMRDPQRDRFVQRASYDFDL